MFVLIEGHLRLYMNRPFLGCLLLLCQNESSRETIDMIFCPVATKWFIFMLIVSITVKILDRDWLSARLFVT